MAAPIIQHHPWSETYDDPDHPIPSLSALDVHVVKKGGGSELLMVIASPLKGDDRSQGRLLRKLEAYMDFIRSPEYEAQCGKPTPQNTAVVVMMHSGSDLAIYELLDRCQKSMQEHGVTLRIGYVNDRASDAPN